ncbi:hypothetical protein TRFO_02975 [Tritrichomonas foetus]|uniref:RING-type domain-containing protein n=1 Tax=Tritrichomonas foetus TaxID=1144522 RepID=A0A1J4KUA6_9EUKA|nr:hypothetical protein TRFO_02975 [Tritrichomonas foetus]|eukprot:OHT14722.1 hypothetical protein TRFO_02975 [Tritrichomonas foetus]
MASSTATYSITNRTRTLWRGSTKKVTVDVHAMNSWNSCGICNHPAQHPVCCPSGDVFCKECMIEFLLEHTKSAKTTQHSTKDEKKTNDINLFMRTQRIAPKVDSQPENSRNIIVTEKRKKVRPKCPICSKKIGMKNLLNLEYKSDSSGPLCCGCENPMIGIVKAYRVPCGHALCESCVNRIAKIDMQCPKCAAKLDKKEIMLLNKSVIDQVGVGGRIVLKAPGLIMPFG